MVLDFLRCVAKGGWVVKVGEFWCFVVTEWSLGAVEP